MIEVRELSVSFASKRVLDRANLSFPGTGIHALMGPGGAGKSTLLRALAGQLPNTVPWTVHGEIRIRGVPLVQVSPLPALLAQRLGQPGANVFELLQQHLPNRGRMTRPEQRDWLARWLARHDLHPLLDRLDTPLLEFADAEVRLAHLAAALLPDPAVLCVDEILAGIEEEDGMAIEALLALAGQQRCVILVSHHQRRVRRLADTVALMAAGEVLAQDTREGFFEHPKLEAQRQYIRTGGLSWPPPDDATDATVPSVLELDDPPPVEGVTWGYTAAARPSPPSPRDASDPPAEAPPAPLPDSPPRPEAVAGTPPRAEAAGDDDPAWIPAPTLTIPVEVIPIVPGTDPAVPPPADVPTGAGPAGFVWLVPGELAGCPQPGVFENMDSDLARLSAAGVSVLVSLTESATVPDARNHGIHVVHFPIPDMHPPDERAALELVAEAERWIGQGHRVAYHCKAGIGRTGTMLVLHLIGRGLDPIDALHVARRRRRDWVQSNTQWAFLHNTPAGFLTAKRHRDKEIRP